MILILMRYIRIANVEQVSRPIMLHGNLRKASMAKIMAFAFTDSESLLQYLQSLRLACHNKNIYIYIYKNQHWYNINCSHGCLLVELTYIGRQLSPTQTLVPQPLEEEIFIYGQYIHLTFSINARTNHLNIYRECEVAGNL